ncbi:Bor family protein [Pyxidicoccus xibeiensis]|nr:Bor family protein [Pyxidicoccus xibeiensis]MCP3142345.1 Bor family protein [Pyxidicoccus xibeiensis]
MTATDVLLSLVTLLIYTPHTLRVTCEQPASAEAR